MFGYFMSSKGYLSLNSLVMKCQSEVSPQYAILSKSVEYAILSPLHTGRKVGKPTFF